MRKRKNNAAHSPAPVSELGAVTKINGRFFLAAVLAILACKLWPERPEWWGMGIVSLCIGIGAFGHAVGGLRDMIGLLVRKRTVEGQTKSAAETKLAREVTRDVLDNAGMKR